MAFSPDGKLLASAGAKGNVWFWEMETGRYLGVHNSGSSIYSLDFSLDAKEIAVGRADGGRIWNVPAAGLEEGTWAGRVVLAADAAAGVALAQAGLEGLTVLTVADTPTTYRTLTERGVPAGTVIGLLWAGLEERDYPGAGGVMAISPLDAGWQEQAARVLAARTGIPPDQVILVTGADSLAAGLEMLGVPGSTIAEVLETRAGAEEELRPSA